MLVSSKSQKDQSWSSIFIEEKNEHVSWMTLFYHAKIRIINFEPLFSLKRKRVRFLNEMFFTDAQVKKISFEAPFPLRRKGPVSWRRAFLSMQKSEGSISKQYFHWREKSLFFEWHVFWRCKSFSPTNQGSASHSVSFYPSVRKHETDGPRVLFVWRVRMFAHKWNQRSFDFCLTNFAWCLNFETPKKKDL